MGHHNRHYAGDPYAAAGVWGKPTSTANFCEEDYAVTLFIAEFINTLTNLAYVYYALRYPNKEPRQSRQLDWMSVALLVLGINSFIFHATLRHTTQFCDEIGMFLLGGALLQGVYTINQPAGRTRLVNIVVLVAVTVLSAIYIHTANILHHVYSFNSMMGLIGARTMYLIYSGHRTQAERWQLLVRFAKAAGILALGYTLWQVDLEKCMLLRDIRKVLGLPLAWTLELHGWWHILTAAGASQFIRLIRALTP